MPEANVNQSSYYKELINTIRKAAKSDKLLEAFLDDILTSSEKEELALRLQIVKLLSHGIPQREVSDKLGVSIATVTRGSKVLKEGKGGIDRIINVRKM